MADFPFSPTFRSEMSRHSKHKGVWPPPPVCQGTVDNTLRNRGPLAPRTPLFLWIFPLQVDPGTANLTTSLLVRIHNGTALPKAPATITGYLLLLLAFLI